MVGMRQRGEHHAEVACLKDAAARGVDPAQCTLVVTLEPCNHQGLTPPCTDAVLAAGIRPGSDGMADVNPEASGGAERLREAGVEVEMGVLEAECRDLVADFIVWQTTARPYVVLKMAATLDGRIATRSATPSAFPARNPGSGSWPCAKAWGWPEAPCWWGAILLPWTIRN